LASIGFDCLYTCRPLDVVICSAFERRAVTY
jgi:hypothetical protein